MILPETKHNLKISLHGGHSGEFCEHAEGTLRETLEAAVSAGFTVYGVSEHAPHTESRFLTQEEIAKGWDIARLQRNFADYTRTVDALAEEFSDRIMILRGYEAEIVPTATYRAQMWGYREQRAPGDPLRFAFDYCVGSVHYVEETVIDYTPELYTRAVEQCETFEAFVVRYYSEVVKMVTTLEPQVVGHLDLYKRFAERASFGQERLFTPRIRAAAIIALEAIRSTGAILDLNTAGWRKGLGEPYPAPWIIAEANHMGVPFCFGDDSHKPADVGAGFPEARDYLLANGVAEIAYLIKEKGSQKVTQRRANL
ncbi:MAG: histidinol-phosphatase [Chthonomonadaceae bacterium]|nr:histidinol-phosphatase [Chthonomonadaceae bacterium]